MAVVIAAAVTGVLSLIGVIVTVAAGQRKTENQIRIAQAVTDTKIEELTREVREHNNFARRMPVVEEQMKTVFKKLEKLESEEKR
jgi:hypothetical protein